MVFRHGALPFGDMPLEVSAQANPRMLTRKKYPWPDCKLPVGICVSRSANFSAFKLPAGRSETGPRQVSFAHWGNDVDPLTRSGEYTGGVDPPKWLPVRFTRRVRMWGVRILAKYKFVIPAVFLKRNGANIIK